jgi:hypothetical protein
MSGTGDWSPDEALDETETYESWDEGLDDEDILTPNRKGDPEGERSLDRQLVLDDAEAEELGVELDDPERLATVDGDIDDPDGLEPDDVSSRRSAEDEGWDLDEEERETAARIDGQDGQDGDDGTDEVDVDVADLEDVEDDSAL